MDAKPLRFKIGQTPFDDISEISFGSEGYSCGTGDSFLTKTRKLKTHPVDIEVYAIAKFVMSKILGLNALNLSLIMPMKARVTTGLKMFDQVKTICQKDKKLRIP